MDQNFPFIRAHASRLTREDCAGRVLIAEDEPKLADLLADYLRAALYSVDKISDGMEVVAAVKTKLPELVILDLMLPGRGGLDICRELRTFTAVPIIIVTARIDEADRLQGLELGADDYICKPFSPREVVARVTTVLRRTRQAPKSAESIGLIIDETGYSATYRGEPLELTPVEFRLLKTLTAWPGRVFSRQQLLDCLYTDHRIVADRTVDSHIRNLRRKLQNAGADDEMVNSVYGVGYRLGGSGA